MRSRSKSRLWAALCWLLIFSLFLAPSRAAQAQSTTVTGWVMRLEVDTDYRQPQPPRYFLQRPGQPSLPLEFAPGVQLPPLPAHLTLTLQPTDGAARQPQAARRVLGAAPAAGTPSPSLPAMRSGSTPFLSILCQFPGSPPSTSPAFITDLINGPAFPSMHHFFHQISFGQTDLSASQTVGWVTLPHPPSTYEPAPSQWNLDALMQDCTALVDAQVNFNDFAGINLILSTPFNLSMGGLGTFQLEGQWRTLGVTWLQPAAHTKQYLLAHEMGHAFGMVHSSGPYGSPYDSYWDVDSGPAHALSPIDPRFDKITQGAIANQRALAGWLPPERIFTFSHSGPQTVTLETLSRLPSSPQSVQMIAIPANHDLVMTYTLELRTLEGYDVSLPGEGVLIHQVNTARLNEGQGVAQIVDVDANADPNDTDAVYTAGETFSDPAIGLNLTIRSIANGQAVIDLERGLSLPSLTRLTPAAYPAQQAPAEYTIEGQGFTPAAQVMFAAQALPTTFIDSTHLTARPSPGAPALQGEVLVRVQQGEGYSNALPLRYLPPRLEWVSSNAAASRANTLAFDASGRAYVGTSMSGYASTDGGQSWTEIVPHSEVRQFIAAPGRLYRITSQGLSYSTNNGQSWTDLATPYTYLAHLAFSPTQPQTLYAAASGGSYFKSQNGGQTWESLYLTTYTAGDNVVQMAVSPHDPALLLAGFELEGIQHTSDGGQIWNPASLNSGHVYAFAFHPQNANEVWAALDSGLYRSLDRGQSWSAVSLPRPASVQAVSFNPLLPTEMLAATSQGFFFSSNGGQSWAERSSGLSDLRLTDARFSATQPGLILAASESHLIFRSTNRGTTWQPAIDGFVSNERSMEFIEADPHDPFHLLAGSSRWLFDSKDGGQTWQTVALPANSLFFKTGSFDPTTPGRAYISTSSGVLRTTDSGQTWQTVNQGLISSETWRTILGVLADPHQPGRVLAVAQDGVFESTNAGEQWAKISAPLPPNLSLTNLLADPAHPGSLWVASHQALLHSSDNGQTWNSLPAFSDRTIYELAADPLPSQRLYAATNRGLFFSEDGGATWSENKTLPFPHPILSSIQVDPLDRNTLYVTYFCNPMVSYDRGLKWFRLGNEPQHLCGGLALSPAAPGGVVLASSGIGLVMPRYAPDLLPTLTGSFIDRPYAGSGFGLYLTGQNFDPSVIGLWDGRPAGVQWQNAQEVFFYVPSDYLKVGSFSIQLVNPSSNGALSNSLSQTITASLPVLKSTEPEKLSRAAVDQTLILRGFYFTPEAQVWSGETQLAVTYLSTAELLVRIPASVFAAASDALTLELHLPGLEGYHLTATVELNDTPPPPLNLPIRRFLPMLSKP